MKRKNIIIIAATTVIVLVAGFLTWFFINSNQEPKLEEEFYNSQVGSSLDEITTVDGKKSATMMVAPATEKWWLTLLGYTTNVDLFDMPFSDISDGATYVAYTNSQGKKYVNYAVIGMPTSYIIYEDEAKAKAAADKLYELGTFTFEQAGNFIIFNNIGAFSDVDFSLAEFEKQKDFVSDKNLIVEDKALVIFNVGDFSNMYKNYLDDYDKETYDTLMAMFGATEETYWTGTSSDGLTWDGKFSNLQLDKTESPATIADFLLKKSYFLSKDGKILPGSEATDSNQSGTIFSRQSTLMSSGTLIVKSRHEAIDYTEDNELGKGTPLTEDEPLYQIKADLNKLLSSLGSFEMEFMFTSFKTVQLDINDVNGESRITFTPLSEEDYLNWEEYYTTKMAELNPENVEETNSGTEG